MHSLKIFHKSTKSDPIVTTGSLYKHHLSSHRSSFSTLRLRRLLYGQWACPSRTLYGIFILSQILAIVKYYFSISWLQLQSLSRYLNCQNLQQLPCLSAGTLFSTVAYQNMLVGKVLWLSFIGHQVRYYNTTQPLSPLRGE